MPKTADLARKLVLSNQLKHYVDLNSDFGQTRDRAFFESTQYELLNYTSSVHIPCGVHDGDPKEILGYIAKAKTFNCSVGAHIGYPDPAHHGYQPMDISKEDLRAWILVQLGAFQALLKENNLEVQHVRPHGALYASFIDDLETATCVAETLHAFSPWVILVAPSGPVLKQVCERVPIQVAPEVYLGKRYSIEGCLLKDSLKENLSPQTVLEQARQLIDDSSLTTADGQTVKLDFKTLHLSPALEGSVGLAEKIVQMLGQPVALPLVDAGASGWL